MGVAPLPKAEVFIPPQLFGFTLYGPALQLLPRAFPGYVSPWGLSPGHRALTLTAAGRTQVHRHPDLPSVSSEGLIRFCKGWTVIVRCEFARHGW